jgi:hypothetical protein
LLWVGTDDGLIHVTSDGGARWTRLDGFPGVPERTYVSCLTASRHATNTVFAAFDHHKNGDFKPYLLRSDDLGKTWTNVAGNLPDRHVVLSVQQDPVQAGLLFVGTELGAWFTQDSGRTWRKIPGLPVIAVRDLEIQQRESDLILGTFGRGIYILDDYSPLRVLQPDLTNQAAKLFPGKEAHRYVPRSRLGNRNGRGFQGAGFYAAPNPPFGAVFTYHLRDKLETRKERRQAQEKKDREAGKPLRQPTFEELQAEQQEREPQLILVVRDADQRVVRRIPGPREQGLHRTAWDLRYPASDPVQLKEDGEADPWDDGPTGPLAVPGRYSVTLVQEVDGVVTELAGPEAFDVVPLELATFAAKDKAAALTFQQKVARLQRAVEGAVRAAGEAATRLDHLRKAVWITPGADPALAAEAERLTDRLTELQIALKGDPTHSRHELPEPPSIQARVNFIVGSQWRVTAPPTQTEQDSYRHAGETFANVLERLRTLMEQDLPAFEAKLEAAGAPWTPGRLPRWEIER